MRKLFVQLPEGEYISCQALVFAIADATTVDPSVHPIYPRSKPLRDLINAARGYHSAPLAPQDPRVFRLNAPSKQHWWEVCAAQLEEVRKWIARDQIHVFTSSRKRTDAPGPDTYMRRNDAEKFCLGSGFEVFGNSVPRHPTSAASQIPSARPAEALGTKPSAKEMVQPPADARLPSIPSNTAKPSRLLRRKDVLLRTGLGRSTFYAYQNPTDPRFDPTFPEPVDIGKGAKAYREDEIEAWVASRPRRKK